MRVSPRQLLATALLACAIAAVFGAAPLAAWVDGSVLGGSVVQQATDGWLAITQRVGLDRPYRMLHNAVRDVASQP